MLVLSTFAFGLLALLFHEKQIYKLHLKYMGIISALLFFIVLSVYFSSEPLSQEIFGNNGQNWGLVTYSAFAILFLVSALMVSQKVLKPIKLAVLISLGVNVVYAFVQFLGIDPVKWVNTSSPLIGTLGNPENLSAFLGIGTAFALSYLLNNKHSVNASLFSLISLGLLIFLIVKCKAPQGFIVLFVNLIVVGFLRLKRKFNNVSFKVSYLLLSAATIIVTAVLVLQKGASIIYFNKAAIEYLKEYWIVAINIIQHHLFFGVGLDSYGDWYRTFIATGSVLRNGSLISVNSAHNTFLDLGVSSGIFALLLYLLIVFYSLKAAIKFERDEKEFNPFFASILGGWIGYLVQSLFSTSSIALGVWGWVFPGLLISFNRWKIESKSIKVIKTITDMQKKKLDFSSLFLASGLGVGLLIGFLPLSSDTNFRNALEIGDANKIYASATRWPRDVGRMIYAAQIFDHNGYPELALKMTSEITKYNSRNYSAWVYIFNNKNTKTSDKRRILKILKGIDPNNPELRNLS
jgi:hypothetical protein